MYKTYTLYVFKSLYFLIQYWIYEQGWTSLFVCI